MIAGDTSEEELREKAVNQKVFPSDSSVFWYVLGSKLIFGLYWNGLIAE